MQVELDDLHPPRCPVKDLRKQSKPQDDVQRSQISVQVSQPRFQIILISLCVRFDFDNFSALFSGSPSLFIYFLTRNTWT